MIKINIFKDKVDGLQKFEDSRGIIADVFYKKPLEHVALIKSEPNTMKMVLQKWFCVKEEI